jgi:hypothetical protein
MLQQPVHIMIRKIADNASRHRLARYIAGIDIRLARHCLESINPLS